MTLNSDRTIVLGGRKYVLRSDGTVWFYWHNPVTQSECHRRIYGFSADSIKRAIGPIPTVRP